jgi:hypothetical protein
VGSRSKVGKKGVREVNSLFNSINYDAYSGSDSRGRNEEDSKRLYMNSRLISLNVRGLNQGGKWLKI